jgi:hypothetical protein
MTSKKEKRQKRRKAKAALRVTERAQDELAKLLKRDQAGSITRADLETGLKEIYEEMASILRFVRASL